MEPFDNPIEMDIVRLPMLVLCFVLEPIAIVAALFRATNVHIFLRHVRLVTLCTFFAILLELFHIIIAEMQSIKLIQELFLESNHIRVNCFLLLDFFHEICDSWNLVT